MLLTIHQPEHLPWLGFFHKMAMADQYVVLDSVQYEKDYFQNRNKIRFTGNDGWKWITTPVLNRGRSTQQIQDVICDQSNPRRVLNVWNAFVQSYKNTPHFDEHEAEFNDIFVGNRSEKLVDMNLRIITLVRRILSIETPMVMASELGVTTHRSKLLAEICEKLGADSYLSGPSGRDYLDGSEFSNRGINVVFHEFHHPEYSQIHGEFMPYMSTIDLIFNHGPRARNILLGDA